MITGKFFIVNGQAKVFPPKPPSPPLSSLSAMTVGAWGDPHFYVTTSSTDSKNRVSTKTIAQWGDNKAGASGNNEIKLLDIQTTTDTIKIYYTNKPWQNTTAKIIDNMRVEYNGTSTTYNNTIKLTRGPVTLNILKVGSGADAYLNFEISWSNINNIVKFGGAIVPILKRVASNNGTLWNGGDGSSWDGIGKAVAPYGLTRSSFETGFGTQAEGDTYFDNVTLLLHGDSDLNDSSSYGRTKTGSNAVSSSSADIKFGSGSIRSRGKYDNGQGGWILFESRDPSTGVSSVPVIGTGDYTVEWWMRLQDYSWNSGYGDTLFDLWNLGSIDPRGSRLMVGFRNDESLRIVEGNTIQDTAALSVPIDSWCHIAICRSSGTRRVYINGVLVLTQSSSHDFTGTRLVLFTNADAIGSDPAGHFTGYLDEFRVTLAARYTGNSFSVPTEAFPNTGASTNTTEELVLSTSEANFLAVSTENFTQNSNIFDNLQNLGENGEGDNAAIGDWDATHAEVLPVLSDPGGLENAVTYFVSSSVNYIP